MAVWTDTMMDRILNRMKVTAIVPDALVSDVQRLARGKNLTESIVMALREWADLQRIRELNRRIEEKPMRFREGFSATAAREASRNGNARDHCGHLGVGGVPAEQGAGSRALEDAAGKGGSARRGMRVRRAFQRGSKPSGECPPGVILEKSSQDGGGRASGSKRGDWMRRVPCARTVSGWSTRQFLRRPPAPARISGPWTAACARHASGRRTIRALPGRRP